MVFGSWPGGVGLEQVRSSKPKKDEQHDPHTSGNIRQQYVTWTSILSLLFNLCWFCYSNIVTWIASLPRNRIKGAMEKCQAQGCSFCRQASPLVGIDLRSHVSNLFINSSQILIIEIYRCNNYSAATRRVTLLIHHLAQVQSLRWRARVLGDYLRDRRAHGDRIMGEIPFSKVQGSFKEPIH